MAPHNWSDRLLKAKFQIWEIITMHSSPVSNIHSCAVIVISCLCLGKVQLGWIYYSRYVLNYVILRWIIMVGFTDVTKERTFVVFHFGVCSSHHYNCHVRYIIKVTSKNLLFVNDEWQALISSHQVKSRNISLYSLHNHIEGTPLSK